MIDGTENIYVITNANILFKLDPNGQLLWDKPSPLTIAGEYCAWLTINNVGQLVTGTNYYVNGNTSGNPNVAIITYDQNGTMLNTRYINGRPSDYIYLYDLSVDGFGNENLIGFFSGSIKFLNNSSDPQYSLSDIDEDFFMIHIGH